MIFDGENMFFSAKALTAADITSDVVEVGAGEASDPLWLVASVAGGSKDGTVSIALQTSDTEDFKTKAILGTFTEIPLQVKIPRGEKKYMRIVATSTYTSGTITSGLVLDDNVMI